jgi:transposase
MYSVELYNRVRRACHVEGMSKSEAARMFGIDRKTVSKILKHSVPPGYRRSKPPPRPKLDPFIPVIDQILEDDKGQLKKQRHTAKRIHQRLRDEHGFTGGITIVTDYVREKKRRSREVFVPLSHPPGHAQVDFGEAVGVIGGVECKLHYFAMALPHSDALFIKTYPAETTEAFCDGHNAAFAFFGGVPLSILYDNTTIAVAKICGDGKRDPEQKLDPRHCLIAGADTRAALDQMQLEVLHVIRCRSLRRSPEPGRKPLAGSQVAGLRRRPEIAGRHIRNHARAKGCHRCGMLNGHGENPLSIEARSPRPTAHTRPRKSRSKTRFSATPATQSPYRGAI